MDYYLKNLVGDTVHYLGSSEDMNAVATRLIQLVNSHYFRLWPNARMDSFFDGYNQTGKDMYYHIVGSHYYTPFSWRPDYSLIQYDYRWSLRPWLVVDENGRHIALDEVKGWIANYKPAPYHYYLGCPPDAVRGRRWHHPALLPGTNRIMDDPDGKAEVEELAGAHIANKLFPTDKPGWGDLWENIEHKAYRRRPKKSWKNKKCRHQWQREKKCGQRPSRPVPVEDLDNLCDHDDDCFEGYDA